MNDGVDGTDHALHLSACLSGFTVLRHVTVTKPVKMKLHQD